MSDALTPQDDVNSIDSVAYALSIIQEGGTLTSEATSLIVRGQEVQRPIHEVSEKASQYFRGWEVGALVHAKYTVEMTTDSEGNDIAVLAVSWNAIGSRSVDTFPIQDLSAADISALKQVGIADLDAIVEVTTQGILGASNTQTYGARIHRILGVQQVWDGKLESLHEGPVLLQGKVIRYSPVPVTSTGGEVVIQMADGTEHTVLLQGGYLGIERGVQSVHNPAYPLVGDTIQLMAHYGTFAERRPKTLWALPARSVYLQIPNEERAHDYEQMRILTRTMLERASQLTSPADIRRLISLLIHQASTGRSLQLTPSEMLQILEISTNKIADPMEQPVLVFNRISQVAEIEESYHVDIYGMSHHELYTFCMQIAEGSIPITNGGPALFEIMIHTLYQAEFERVLLTGITRLLPIVDGKRTIVMKPFLIENGRKRYPDSYKESVLGLPEEYDPDELANPENAQFSTSMYLEMCFHYLGHATSPEVTSLLLGLIHYIQIEKAYAVDLSDRGKHYCYSNIFDAITTNICRLTIRESNWTSPIRELRDAEAEVIALQYIGALPVLEALRQEMTERVGANPWLTPTSQLVNTIHYIKELRDFLQKGRLEQ